MIAPRNSHCFVYVESDIPEGMTIRAWQTQRATDNAARRRATRLRRRQWWARRRHLWLEALRVRLARP